MATASTTCPKAISGRPVNILAKHLGRLRTSYPGAHTEPTSDGMTMLHVPAITVDSGWNRTEVALMIMIPAGYPHVKPDCFYADADLRLASGAEPGNSTIQVLSGRQYRWFSWHLTSWDAAKDGLEQFVRSCERRLREHR